MGDSFLDRIVTGDDTWVKHENRGTKLLAMEWGHTNSAKKPRKCWQTSSARNIRATVFGDWQGVLLINILERGATINSVRDCETLHKLRKAIQNRCRGNLSHHQPGNLSTKMFLHDNARPHTANSTREVPNVLMWDIFPHPHNSPDLATSDNQLVFENEDLAWNTALRRRRETAGGRD